MMPPSRVRASIAKQISDAWRLTAGASMTNPLTELSWYSAFWASDPSWSNPADGAAVSSWRNGGTLGTAAEQATGASRPTYRSANSVLNNRPVVDFDGTDDRLEITTGVSLAQPFSVVWIGTLDVVAAITTSFVGLNDTANGNRFGTALDGGNPVWSAFMGGATAFGGTPAIDTAYMGRAYFNGASSAISVNGTSVDTGDAGALAVNQVVLGAGRLTGPTYARFLNGKTAFLGIYSGDITASPRWNDFKAWVRSYYGITIS